MTAPPPHPDGVPRPEHATRALAATLLLGVLGASLTLFAASKTWTSGTAAFAGTQAHVHATGSRTTALPGALALVALAALVAVFAVRRAGRYAVCGLLTLCGAGVVAADLARRGDHGAVDDAATTATGLSHATAEHVTTTAWPLLSVAAGVLILLAGLLALRYGRHWPAMSGRYDRAGAPGGPGARAAAGSARPVAVPVDLDRSEDVWKALDRGEDPT